MIHQQNHFLNNNIDFKLKKLKFIICEKDTVTDWLISTCLLFKSIDGINGFVMQCAIRSLNEEKNTKHNICIKRSVSDKDHRGLVIILQVRLWDKAW